MTIVRTRTQWTGIDQDGPGVTTLYFDGGSSTAIIVADLTGFLSDLEPLVSTNYDYEVEGTADLVDETTGLITSQVNLPSPPSGSGTDSASPLANQTQACISWQTGAYVNGRQLRARTFVPGPTIDSSDGGEPSAAYLSALTSAASGLHGDIVAFSRTHLVAELVTGSRVMTEWSVLRSRR